MAVVRTLTGGEVEHPWPETDVCWRFPTPEIRHAMLRKEVTKGGDFLVRETLVATYRSGLFDTNLGLGQVKKVLSDAEDEYEALRTAGLTIPHVERFTFGESGRTTTLTRVPIIEGIDLEETWGAGIIKSFSAIIGCYTRGGRFWREQYLGDVGSNQYVYGQLKPAELAPLTPEPSICLVDFDTIMIYKNN